MDRKKRFPFRCIVFLILLAAVSVAVLSIYKVGHERAYSYVYGLKTVEKSELDAIFIGGSDIHAFWQPVAAWNAHGITSWNYSVDMYRFTAMKNYIIEARKTQPDAVFVLSMNTMKRTPADITTLGMHNTLDFFPLSANKLDLISRLCDDAGIKGLDRLEYYLPGVRFHSRLKLKSWEFKQPDTSYMTSLTYSEYLNTSKDVTECYLPTEERGELDEVTQTRLNELLDFIESEGVKVLFITVPQMLNKDERHLSMLTVMNTVKDRINERGLPILDVMAASDEIGIQLSTDFYNFAHTNIHGSLKVTEYISQYLIENYGFTDKHGTACAARWDKAAEDYGKLANAASLPLEREYAPRDYSLAAPHVYGYLDGDVDLKLMWEPVSGAEGYEIYRKSKVEERGAWHLVAEAAAEPNAYLSSGLEPETEYSFTVVPYRTEAGERVYGSFDFAGFSITTAGEAEGGDEE